MLVSTISVHYISFEKTHEIINLKLAPMLWFMLCYVAIYKCTVNLILDLNLCGLWQVNDDKDFSRRSHTPVNSQRPLLRACRPVATWLWALRRWQILLLLRASADSRMSREVQPDNDKYGEDRIGKEISS